MHEAYVESTANKLIQQAADTGKPIKATAVMVSGRAHEGIVEYSESVDSDFILMATHGRSGLNRWVLGSVALKVLRKTNRPVWLIKNGASVNCDWTKTDVIVPLDESVASESILPFVGDFVRAWGAGDTRIILTNVCREPIIPSDFTDEMRDIWRDKEAREAEISTSNAQQYLDKIKVNLTEQGQNVTTKVLIGKPAEEIVNLASNNPFSIIVMSTHGQSGKDKWVYGSTTERVIVGAPCPVLLLKPKA
jgi:nucleotide-binding universal stress UspA family protein